MSGRQRTETAVIALTLFFHPLASYCQKVLIALYENETPFQGKIVNFSDEKVKGDFLALWATGEHFSIADCAAAPSLFFAEAVYEIPKSNPRLLDYFDRLMQRQSVRRAIAEARPYFQFFPLKDALPNRFRSDA